MLYDRFSFCGADFMLYLDARVRVYRTCMVNGCNRLVRTHAVSRVCGRDASLCESGRLLCGARRVLARHARTRAPCKSCEKGNSHKT